MQFSKLDDSPMFRQQVSLFFLFRRRYSEPKLPVSDPLTPRIPHCIDSILNAVFFLSIFFFALILAGGQEIIIPNAKLPY
jgi:hypothetical protein